MNELLTIAMLFVTTVATSNFEVINLKPTKNKRLNVIPQGIVTRSTKIKCAATCRSTSWCVSANLSPDRITCQLLTEEVSNEASLESADGWSYIR